jgi:hypothetical protein
LTAEIFRPLWPKVLIDASGIARRTAVSGRAWVLGIRAASFLGQGDLPVSVQVEVDAVGVV